MRPLHILATGLLLLILITPGCSPHYISATFEEETIDHQVIAVLPFEMVYTGIRPDGLSDEDMIEIERAESRAFQISYYHEILKSTRSGRKPIRVHLQDVNKTNRTLTSNDIILEKAWELDGDYLAELLQVDAVVQARILKNRLMPDLASYGIELGVHILDEISGHSVWPWLPYGALKSKEIEGYYTLVDGYSGDVIWSVFIDEEADWRQRANDIIDSINRRSARRFPYRM